MVIGPQGGGVMDRAARTHSTIYAQSGRNEGMP